MEINGKRINELLELRNSLVEEEDQIELYDLSDAFDNEEDAVAALLKEIGELKL